MMSFIDGQSCFDMVDVNQQGSDLTNTDQQVLVPNSDFSCNGRITRYMVSLNQDDDEEGDYPRIQVWRPTTGQQYTRINQYTIQRSDIRGMGNYYLADKQFTGSNRIEFQSGDIIGYYRPEEPHYSVWSIQTSGYISYSRSETSNSFSLDNANEDDNRQPLIQVILGMFVTDCLYDDVAYNAKCISLDVRCDDLLMPPNGEITSCTSNMIGVGYETESCTYACNTGYELTGSDTRTCQTSGSWTGTDDVCRRGTFNYAAQMSSIQAIRITWYLNGYTQILPAMKKWCSLQSVG